MVNPLKLVRSCPTSSSMPAKWKCCGLVQPHNFAKYPNATGKHALAGASSNRCPSCNLGVYVDAELTMREHVSRTARVCFFNIRRLRSVRRQLGCQVTAQLVTALILSRLDYCNAVLAGLPASTLAPLQRVLNVAARLVLELGPRVVTSHQPCTNCTGSQSRKELITSYVC